MKHIDTVNPCDLCASCILYSTNPSECRQYCQECPNAEEKYYEDCTVADEDTEEFIAGECIEDSDEE